MKLYTIPEAAKELGVHPHTIRDWIAKGKIEAITYENPQRNTYRITEETIKAKLSKEKL